MFEVVVINDIFKSNVNIEKIEHGADLRGKNIVALLGGNGLCKKPCEWCDGLQTRIRAQTLSEVNRMTNAKEPKEKVLIEKNGDMLIRIPAGLTPSELRRYFRSLIPLCYTTDSSIKMTELAG